MRVIAIVNQKGGSGKTTTSVNLAAALGEQRRRVLVVDLDPQASASSWLGVSDGGRGLLDLFTDGTGISELIRASVTEGVSLIPSSSWLVGVDKALVGEAGAESILKRKLEALPEEEWDYVLFDCPPTLGTLAVNALAAAREVLVPVEAHVLPLAGVVQLLELVEVVKERLNPELAVTGILACRVDARTRHSREVVEKLRERFGPIVYRTVLRESVRLAECPSFHQPILSYAARSTGAKDYREAAKELIEQERSS